MFNKQVRFQRPCNGVWDLEELPFGWSFHTEEPTIELVELALLSFHEDIGDYDGMWNKKKIILAPKVGCNIMNELIAVLCIGCLAGGWVLYMIGRKKRKEP